MAWIRVVASVAAAMAAAFALRGPNAVLLQVLSGLVWVPWAAALVLLADRAPARIVRALGAATDLMVVFTLSRLLPGFGVKALLGYALVLVGAAYTADRAFRLALGVAALAAGMGGSYWTSAGDVIDPAVVASFVMVVLAVTIVLDRAATERERARDRSAFLEEKAAVILDHVADGVMVTDPSGWIAQCNPAFARIVGSTRQQLIRRSCTDVLGLHAGEGALDCSATCPLLALGSCEVWRLREDGRRQPLLASASQVTSDAGGTAEVVHSLRDVTQLKQADEAKTIFLATASHELKTPLTVIGGFAETLLRHDDIAESARRTALEAISRRSLELSQIVDRLLLSSRIDAGRAEVRLAQVDAAELVRERIDAWRESTGRSITFAEWDVAPALADPQALVTVVDQLVDNAIKYSPDGDRVEVRILPADDLVAIEVADHGIGMDEEARAHCFERFWQAESTDVRRFGGTGIGLYIVQSLVDAMGGVIDVWSEPGRGARFRILLRTAVNEIRDLPSEGERSIVREFIRQIVPPAGAIG